MEYHIYYPLNVELKENVFDNENTDIPAYEFILKPLIKNCLYAYVYGLRGDSKLYIQNKDILIYEKGKYRFDLTKECVTGHENLWNARKWNRGSIVIILENDLEIFEKIFKYTYNPSLLGTPNSGNTKSAIKKCKEEMNNNRIGICITASNGIDWIQIYIEQEKADELFLMAEQNCKKSDHESQAREKLKELLISVQLS